MDTRYGELKKVLTVILKMYQKKKAEYQLNSIYDLKSCGEVPFLDCFKNITFARIFFFKFSNKPF